MTTAKKARFCLTLGLRVLLALTLLALPVTPAIAAQSTVDAAKSTTPDPAIKKAMMTLPDAGAKWAECYKNCMAADECTPGLCASQCEGQVVNSGYAASQTSEMLNYNVMGIYGAECIGNFSKYLKTLRDAAKMAHNSGLSLGNMLAAVIVDQILDAVISQILNNLTNQICNVTNQITQAADSFVKNAICVPNININPFNFNLNLKNLQCDGFAINPLTGAVNGTPITGVPGLTTPTNIYDSGAVANPTLVPDTVIVPTAPGTTGLLAGPES